MIGRCGCAAPCCYLAERRILIMRGKETIDRNDLAHVLVAVVNIEERLAAMSPDERTRGDGFRRIPHVGIASVVGNLQVAVLDEVLVVLRHAAAHAVVAHYENCSILLR